MYLTYKRGWGNYEYFIVGDNDINIAHRLFAQEKKQLIKDGKSIRDAKAHKVLESYDTVHYNNVSNSAHECVSMVKYLQNVEAGDKRLYLFTQTGYILCPTCKELFSMTDRPLEEGCICGQKEFVINKDAKMRQYSVLEKIQSGAKVAKKVCKYVNATMSVESNYSTFVISSTRKNKAGASNYIRFTVEYMKGLESFKEIIETECSSDSFIETGKKLSFIGDIFAGSKTDDTENLKENISKMLLTDNMCYSAVKSINSENITSKVSYKLVKDMGPDEDNQVCELKIDDYFIDNFDTIDIDKLLDYEDGNDNVTLGDFNNLLPYYKEGLRFLNSYGHKKVYYNCNGASNLLKFGDISNLLKYTPDRIKELLELNQRIEFTDSIKNIEDLEAMNPMFFSNKKFILEHKINNSALNTFLAEYACISSDNDIRIVDKKESYLDWNYLYNYKDINSLKATIDTFSIAKGNGTIFAVYNEASDTWSYSLRVNGNHSCYSKDSWTINNRKLKDGFILSEDIPSKIKKQIISLSDDAKYIILNASRIAPIQAYKFFNRKELDTTSINDFHEVLVNMISNLESKANKENVSLLRKYFESGVRRDEEILALLYISQKSYLKCGNVNILSLVREALLQNMKLVTVLDLLEFRYNAIQRGDILQTEKINYSSLRTEHDFYMGLNEGSMTLITTNFDYEGYKTLKFTYKTETSKKEYKIVNPKNYKDIIEEATTLRHCLKNYISKVSTGDHMILFVRENESKPLYTISVDKSGFIFHSGGKWMSPVPTSILIAAQQAILNSPETLEAIDKFYK